MATIAIGQAWANDVAGFKLTVEKDGIQVFTREVEGSNLKEFRGSMKIRTSLASLVALMQDTEAYPTWVHNCRAAKVISETNFFEQITWRHMKTPWPVSDRDSVTFSRLTQEAKSGIVTYELEARPHAYPVQPGVVRIPAQKGFWRFTPEAEGYVTVVFQLHLDPGGALPTALANASAKDLPFKTLQNLRRVIVAEKYRSAKFAQIKEKVS